MNEEPSQALHGSQRWLQIAVNRSPEVLNSPIVEEFDLGPRDEIKWISPLESEDFAEYRDAEFLERLGVCLKRRSLNDFWPSSGPRWDGLARISGPRFLLLEAKANIPEFDSTPTRATGASLEKINAALSETKKFLGVNLEANWSQCFYQYANRLAHLYLLRELNGLDAYLVFVYFLNDRTVSAGDPVSQEGWEAAITLVTKHLGIPNTRWTSENVKDVFIDVNKINHVSWP